MATVLDYGVHGDGVIDDTEALQHAIDEGNGELIFPEGNYLISKTLVIDLEKLGRLQISGSGGQAKVIMAGPGPAFLIRGTHGKSADPLSFKPEIWQNERFPTIDGLEIEGAHPQADGIRIQGTMQSTLTRLAIRHVHTAIHVHERARNILIDSCQIYYNTGIGIHLDHLNLHQIIISSSHISYCRLGGIRINDSEIRNIQITGNDIEYNNSRTFLKRFPEDVESPNETAEIYIDTRNGSVREGTICSNTIQATVVKGGCNIRLIGTDNVEGDLGLISITGNLIGNEETNLHFTRVWGVTVSGNQIYGSNRRNILVEESRNVVISGNMIGHMPDFNRTKLATGIRLENSSECLINGLQIQDPQVPEKATPATIPEGREALIELVGCQQINVTGSQIFDAILAGLLVENSKNVTINSTQIIDKRPESQMDHGIILRGELTDVIVSSCLIRNAKMEPVVGATVQGVILMNNVT
ncbi:right-handed parallel beta-helix repeat-containing protein [Planctomicrobium sp. SH527]|uniref:right-handed parallel beta-helix repeat-containing protein n=1 Tax=Planctomicrobium sp. SH527 TaxID=3448123 RepID=UPI003F5C15F8